VDERYLTAIEISDLPDAYEVGYAAEDADHGLYTWARQTPPASRARTADAVETEAALFLGAIGFPHEGALETIEIIAAVWCIEAAADAEVPQEEVVGRFGTEFGQGDVDAIAERIAVWNEDTQIAAGWVSELVSAWQGY